MTLTPTRFDDGEAYERHCHVNAVASARPVL